MCRVGIPSREPTNQSVDPKKSGTRGAERGKLERLESCELPVQRAFRTSTKKTSRLIGAMCRLALKNGWSTHKVGVTPLPHTCTLNSDSDASRRLVKAGAGTEPAAADRQISSRAPSPSFASRICPKTWPTAAAKKNREPGVLYAGVGSCDCSTCHLGVLDLSRSHVRNGRGCLPTTHRTSDCL